MKVKNSPSTAPCLKALKPPFLKFEEDLIDANCRSSHYKDFLFIISPLSVEFPFFKERKRENES